MAGGSSIGFELRVLVMEALFQMEGPQKSMVEVLIRLYKKCKIRFRVGPVHPILTCTWAV